MTARPLFVYGTLRPGTNHPMQRWLQNRSDDLGPAVYRGRLYQVAWYPALLPSNQPCDRVQGNILRLHEQSLWTQLDEYEGAEFRRQEIEVRQNGRMLRVWAYLYDGPTSGAPRIKSGDFLHPHAAE